MLSGLLPAASITIKNTSVSSVCQQRVQRPIGLYCCFFFFKDLKMMIISFIMIILKKNIYSRTLISRYF